MANARRAAKRAATEAQRRAARAIAAADAERQAEEIAPAAQRRDVVASDGSVVRIARLERAGVGYIRQNVLPKLSGYPASHVAAATRLLSTWDAVAEGVGLGASNWDAMGGSGGGVPTGPAGHSALLAQVAQRQEIAAISAYLGALWPVTEAIICKGMPINAWAIRRSIGADAASRHLKFGVDRLVQFYTGLEAPGRPSRLRAVEVISIQVGA